MPTLPVTDTGLSGKHKLSLKSPLVLACASSHEVYCLYKGMLCSPGQERPMASQAIILFVVVKESRSCLQKELSVTGSEHGHHAGCREQ